MKENPSEQGDTGIPLLPWPLAAPDFEIRSSLSGGEWEQIGSPLSLP